MTTLQAKYSSDAVAGDTQWVNLEQDGIPPGHEQATMADLSEMLAATMYGQSAFTAFSTCPVIRSAAAGGGAVASYDATVLVHTSKNLDYSFDAGGRATRVQRGVIIDKSESIDIDYRKTIELGWQPATISTFFESQVYSQSAGHATPPDIEQDNGFLYLSDAVWGILRANGTALVDAWTVTITHELGTKWSDTVTVTVKWNDGKDEKTLDLKLPVCVEDAFNECAGIGDLPGGGGGGYWENINLNSTPVTVYYNDCSGDILRVDT